MRKFILIALLIAHPVLAAPSNAVRLDGAVTAYKAGRFDEARSGFKELADQGSAIAETMLGMMYAEGRGVKADPATAVAYFYRAAHRGYAPAQLALSDAYAKGRGTWQNLSAAYKWARLAQLHGAGAMADASHASAVRLAREISAEQRRKADRAVLNWRPWATSAY